MQKLRLIWDFHGPNASKIAEHHENHLKDYIELEKLNVDSTGVNSLNDNHTIAFLIVDEDKMKPLRDALKPHRGQLVTNEST